jgi:nicotinate-nucleotide pyrophosphorylase (carboxylating)
VSPKDLDASACARSVRAALDEDLGIAGDITSQAAVLAGRRGKASFVAREPMVVAGLPVVREVFRALDPGVAFAPRAADGDEVPQGAIVAEATGDARSLLAGERVALNFLQRMSGIATAAREAVREVAGTEATVLDTRKTVPGLRALDKYAVAAGGAANHRAGLYDAVMIKDTHVEAAGGLGEAIRRCLAAGYEARLVTAEVRTPDELDKAIAAGAGRALLDNMDLDTLGECVRRGKGRIVLEASGGLRPGMLRSIALTGVDALSLGYLTHSVRAADLAMDLEALP